VATGHASTGDKKNQYCHATGDMLIRCKKQNIRARCERTGWQQQKSVEHI